MFSCEFPDHIGSKLLGFTAGRTVADRHQFDAMAQHHSLDGCLGLVHPFELRHRVDDAGIQHLAGWVNNSKFAAHAVAGVKPEHDACR